MKAICQRCQETGYHWGVRQAEFNVGAIEHWKLQLCPSCTETIQDILPKRHLKTPPAPPIPEASA